MTDKEYCSICNKNLTNKTAWSCDSEPCILEDSGIGLLCIYCGQAHALNTNHEVTKIK